VVSRALVALLACGLACGGPEHPQTDAGGSAPVDAAPAGAIVLPTWPGSQLVTVASEPFAFGGNVSGLVYEPAQATGLPILWAIQNTPAKLHRLSWNGLAFTGTADAGWDAGKILAYPDGTGSPDGEGLTRTAWESSEMYVAAETDSLVGESRLSILRYDLTSLSSTLAATHEWNLTADLPAVDANKGLEGIAWVPDAYLLERGFVDESRDALYAPPTDGRHAGGVFLVGVESTGAIYGYVLDLATGGFRRVTAFASGQAAVMDLSFDRDGGVLFSLCDDACEGRITLLDIGADGRFGVRAIVPAPTALADMNSEGFAPAPDSECQNGGKPCFWADDDESAGFSIRRGTILCGRLF
jgi:hypothetical protein